MGTERVLQEKSVPAVAVHSGPGRKQWNDNRLQAVLQAKMVETIQCRTEGEELLMQGKSALQREAEEEETVQGCFVCQRKDGGMDLSGYFLPVQRQKIADDPESYVDTGELWRKAVASSDGKTHFSHMKAGGKFADDAAFISESHRTVYENMLEQTCNRTRKEALAELQKEQKKKVRDQTKIAQLKTENRTGIPDEVKQRMEHSFAADFSSVRVHPDSSVAPRMKALAYTQGTDIHFAPGQFKPETIAGQQLLGHELTHVIQQREGRVHPTTEIGGMAVNDDAALEREADIKGARAAQH